MIETAAHSGWSTLVPPSEVFFADTHHKIGPLGAKSQDECAINPVRSLIKGE
jgi:hypothetical protein